MSEPQSLSSILDEIERRADAAMRGPWFTETLGRIYVGNKSSQSCGLWNIVYSGEYEDFREESRQSQLANATFIAAARSDVPKLVKALRRAVGALEDSRRAFNEILTIQWGWDGDCGADRLASDGFDVVDDTLKAILSEDFNE